MKTRASSVQDSPLIAPRHVQPTVPPWTGWTRSDCSGVSPRLSPTHFPLAHSLCRGNCFRRSTHSARCSVMSVRGSRRIPSWEGSGPSGPGVGCWRRYHPSRLALRLLSPRQRPLRGGDPLRDQAGVRRKSGWLGTKAFHLLTLLLLLATPLSAQQIYDLLLKNGHVIDPKNQRNGRYDIAVIGNKIVRVGENLPSSNAKLVVDVSQYYVTPGLIDIHTHFDAQGAGLNLNPDHNALSSGVTTAVDAGSSGWKNFEQFQRQVINHSQTRLLAFLNIVGAGMYGAKVENDVQEMDSEAAARMVKKYPQTIVGIKTAHFQPPTWDAVDRAVKAAELSNSVLMVDFHPKPGRGYPELILNHMRPGDIHTHFYGRLTPQLDAQKKVQPYMWEARKRGVLFDVGHGSGSFWFRIAVPAIEQGFLPDTISTDIHKDSIMLSRANMITTMSKFLNIGMTLEQVIERSTVNPAKAIRRPELGTLGEDSVADIAVLALEKGSFAFLDSGHGKLIGDKRLRCVLTVRNGKVVWDTEGLSLTEWSHAGPYSNFK